MPQPPDPPPDNGDELPDVSELEPNEGNGDGTSADRTGLLVQEEWDAAQVEPE